MLLFASSHHESPTNSGCPHGDWVEFPIVRDCGEKLRTQEKTLFSLQGWVCSAVLSCIQILLILRENV